MPISDDEWQSGKQWTTVERAVAEFLSAVAPRAYTVPELHDLLADGGTVTPPQTDVWGDESDEHADVDVAPMDVTEREVQEAVTTLRDGDTLESKRIQTDDGVHTHYREADSGFL